eukprot:scaffold74088_cov49-Phaeocystis_antarctica.AAC.2
MSRQAAALRPPPRCGLTRSDRSSAWQSAAPRRAHVAPRQASARGRAGAPGPGSAAAAGRRARTRSAARRGWRRASRATAACGSACSGPFGPGPSR